jgi:two-component system, NarL family, response regulator DevR
VSFRFPSPAGAPTLVAAMAGLTGEKKRLSVFHVDDSAALRQRIRQEIEQLGGIEVVGDAAEAEAAIAQIRRYRPDIVILDLQLAEGSGIDILRELQGDDATPVRIVLTNDADSISRELSLRAGAHYFFDKSAHFDEFLLLMKRL